MLLCRVQSSYTFLQGKQGLVDLCSVLSGLIVARLHIAPSFVSSKINKGNLASFFLGLNVSYDNLENCVRPGRVFVHSCFTDNSVAQSHGHKFYKGVEVGDNEFFKSLYLNLTFIIFSRNALLSVV